ncbi:MAG: nucleolar 14 family protein, partial [Planctomycetes bacterium]|nr:nucleolar 14 family protein [Planctomycetota bacterium]
MGYKRTKHPGVSFVRRRRDTRDVLEMQWVDPDTGKKQQKSLTKMGYKSKSDAMKELIKKSKELKAAKERIDKGQRREGIDEEWTTIFKDYLKHYAAENSEDAANRNKRDWLCRWEKFLEAKRIARGAHLKSAHLSEFRLQLSKDLGKRTRNRHLDAVKALLKWCIDRGNVR